MRVSIDRSLLLEVDHGADALLCSHEIAPHYGDERRALVFGLFELSSRTLPALLVGPLVEASRVRSVERFRDRAGKPDNRDKRDDRADDPPIAGQPEQMDGKVGQDEDQAGIHQHIEQEDGRSPDQDDLPEAAQVGTGVVSIRPPTALIEEFVDDGEREEVPTHVPHTFIKIHGFPFLK